MLAKPQKEHQWLEQLVGDWSVQTDCKMPDGSDSSSISQMTCRMLHGMWLICEGTAESPGGPWSSMITLGFDPQKGCYVGTFIGSMMTYLWLYQGVMDASGNRLSLESEGPAFIGEGTCKYRDTIQIIDADHWLFTSELQNEAGEWIQFMTGKHARR